MIVVGLIIEGPRFKGTLGNEHGGAEQSGQEGDKQSKTLYNN